MTLTAAQAITKESGSSGRYRFEDAPQTKKRFVVKSGVTIRKGGIVCLDTDGYADQYYQRADYLRCGRALESVTGDGTLTISVYVESYVEESAPLTSAAQSSVGKPYWITESGETYTLTQPTPTAEPAGRVKAYVSSGVADLEFYPMARVLNLRDSKDAEIFFGRDRQRLVKEWERLPAATQAATTDLDIDATGTNIATATIAVQAGGGASLATAGANNDQARLFPLAVSNWYGPFAPSRRPVFITKIKTGASIASILIHAGLRLTDVMDLTTDDDALLFLFDTASAHTALMYAYSIAGTDTAAATTGVTLAVNTNYTLAIVVRDDGYGEFYVGDANSKVLKRVGVTSSAVTAAAALRPQIVAVQALTGAAKTVITRYAEISQDHE